MNAASYYLGFGWIPLTSCLLFGFASYYYSTGWIHWVLYFLFVIVLAYMVTKFRLYSREPWRRVHAQGMSVYRDIMKREIETADKENRDCDIVGVCNELAQRLSDGSDSAKILVGDLLTDAARKAYYRQLVDTYPSVFTQRIKPEHHTEAIERIRKDIDSSELGPDIIIAAVIEKTYGQLESARFLLALVTGVAMRKGLFV